LAGTAANSNLCTASRLAALTLSPSLFLYFSHLSEEAKVLPGLNNANGGKLGKIFFFLSFNFFEKLLGLL